MKYQTILVSILVFFVLYIVILKYNRKFCNSLINSIQYGIPHFPSPLKIYHHQIKTDRIEENFSQTMQDELSTTGSYSSKPLEIESPSFSNFNKCVNLCDAKMTKCIAAGNPTSCEYNYNICRQDCGWSR